MTMETVESQQDGNSSDSMAETDSGHARITNMAQVAAMNIEDSPESPRAAARQNHRELLSRRPSYNRILNELSTDVSSVPKIDEEDSEDEGVESSSLTTMNIPSSIYQTSTGQYITISQGGTIQLANPDGVQGLQTLSMANPGSAQPGTTILQYATQSADGTQQFFVQGGQVLVQAASGDMPAYQIRTATSALSQGVVVGASSGNLHSPQQMAEEATRKRELRLMKNRVAAKDCRRRKKEYIKCLESRVAVLEVQNKKLIEEVETLKSIYSSETN